MHRNGLFDETVVSLYDAATDIDKWPAFLERLGELFDASVGQVLYWDFEHERLAFEVIRGMDHIPPEAHGRFLELAREDPHVQAMVRFPGKPLTSPMLMDRQSYESSKVHKEFLGPVGIGGYGKTMAVHLEPSAFVSVVRLANDPAFDDDEVACLGRLVPHFRRALALHRKLALLEMERQDALAALDAMPLGIVLTDGDGRLRQANRTAREIAARGDGLLFSGNYVAAHRRADTARLLEAVEGAVRGALNGRTRPGEAISVVRRNGDPAYPVVVSVVWGNQQKLGLGHLDRPLAALFVTDPDRPQEAPAELLQRLFGLTAAEAALAERLAGGQALPDAAAALGVSHNTARTHLRHIFDKTATARQGELVKKIMDTPVWISALREAEAWRRSDRLGGWDEES